MKKLRVWLIHKLGGIVPADTPPVKKKEVEIIDIHASADFTEALLIETDKDDSVKFKNGLLVSELARKIISSGLVTITREPLFRFDPERSGYRETATIHVISDADARIENCDAIYVKHVATPEQLKTNFGMW